MSVYTAVTHSELETFLDGYNLGNLKSYSGIENGITNSNFWLETESGKYVLTLYEHHSPADLGYILGLQHHLHYQGILCASPVIDKSGNFFSRLNSKPAAINHRIDGAVCENLTPEICKAIGNELARFHLQAASFTARRENPCDSKWQLELRQKLKNSLKGDENRLLDEEIDACCAFEQIDLPRGAIHADLFHDNCLFDDERFCGFIDFDYACHDCLLFDIAVTVNDWCKQDDGKLVESRYTAFFEGYQQIRPLLTLEKENLNLMLRAAALRFWLSRLHDLHFPKAGELTYCKDPGEFKKMLLLRRQYPLVI